MKLGSEPEHQKLQRECHKMLLDLFDKGEIDLNYSLDSKQAQKSVEDFLEANKFNHSRIAYAVGQLHNEDDEVLNISLRKSASIFQRLLGRLGAGRPKSDVTGPASAGVGQRRIQTVPQRLPGC
jgi:hypothetical protein